MKHHRFPDNVDRFGWLAGWITHRTLLLLFAVLIAGCTAKPESDVTLYSTLEQETAMPILAAFERAADNTIGVVSRFDPDPAEQSRLTSQIIATASDEPPCDVIWNAGVLETMRLQKLGRLASRTWAVESGWPSNCIASDGSWCGFSATARVIIVNTTLIKDPAEYPTSVLELADEKWQGRCAVGMPTIGNTATHFAVLRDQLGREVTLNLLREIRDSALVLPGSRQVAIAVAAGQAAWGVTDTDAAIREVDLRHQVAILFPDQGPSQLGTLRIPSTTAVIKSAKHPISAGMLADHLIHPATQERLAMGDGSELPLNRNPKFPPRVLTGDPVRWMNADFELAAEHYDEWLTEVQSLFKSPE